MLADANTAISPLFPFFPQAGKVVIILSGRFAGKKAVIVKNFDEGTTSRQYGHALVVGLSKVPRKVRTGLLHLPNDRVSAWLREQEGRAARGLGSLPRGRVSSSRGSEVPAAQRMERGRKAENSDRGLYETIAAL